MKKRSLLVLSITSLFMTPIVSAQDFTIDWFGVASGGGSSGGGDFELSATVGESEAGAMQGGDFDLGSGFWSILPLVQTSAPLALNVSLDQGSVVIAWPANGSAGFTLEEATALTSPGSWAAANLSPQASNGTNTVRLPITAGNRFYRLRKN